MKNEIKSAALKIESGEASCIVLKDGIPIKQVSGKGIKPIVDMYDEGILTDSSVVDKVVGRAAAMIMTLGGVKYCYAQLISDGAKEFFLQSGVELEYKERCAYVVNRTGDGPCPMENAVKGTNSPERALELVREQLEFLARKV